MTKIMAFKVRKDEEEIFKKYATLNDLELETRRENLNEDTVDMCVGCNAVIIQGSCNVSSKVVEKLSQFGCKSVVTRAIGYNNIDLEACKQYGLNAANVTYSPASVSEHTVMVILMALRHMKRTFINISNNNPTFNNVKGRELKNLCVGVIGYGNIAKTVIENLKGFNCEVIVNDHNPDKDFVVEYVALDELFKRADIITLHIPLNEDTYHFISDQEINKMKHGVVLINTARGGLLDTKSLVKNLKNNKIGACALDVFEDENKTLYDFKNKVDNDFAELSKMDNVILTPHMAFFTDSASEDCIKIAYDNIVEFNKGFKPSFSLVNN